MDTEKGDAEAQGAEAAEAAGLGIDDATKLMAGREADATAEGEESKAEPGAEAETESDADEAKEEWAEERREPVEFSPEQQAILEREIGKKVARHKEELERLTDRISELEGQLTSADRSQTPKGGAGPDLFAMRPEQLDRYEAELQARLDWLEENQDGYEADPEVKDDVSLSRQQVLKALVTNRKLLREIPAARQARADFAHAETAAVQAYPELARGKPDRVVYDRFCAMVPEFRRIPNGLILVGDMLAGERARAKAQAEKQGRKPTAPTAPKLPGQQGVKKPVAANGKPISYTIEKMVSDGGTMEAATRLMMEREKHKG